MRSIVLLIALTGLLLFIGCGSSLKEEEERSVENRCTEPENPYREGSGHYAGYEWAEKNGGGSCSSSSDSFNEGCEEYESQESEYQDCQSKRKR
jgi:hypothetical protein